jgi:hypothetical protein
MTSKPSFSNDNLDDILFADAFEEMNKGISTIVSLFYIVVGY